MKRTLLFFFVLFSAFMQITFAQRLTQLWKIDAGVDPRYPATSDWYRGAAFNSATDHYLVISRALTPKIYIHNAATGALLDSMNITGVTGGTFALNDIEVASDGVVFASNLITNSGSDTTFKVYRWATEAAAPTVAYTGRPGTARMGDAFDVAGAGAATRIYASGNAAASVIQTFTTSDGIAFTLGTPIPIVGQSAGAGIAQVTPGGNAFTSRFSLDNNIRLVNTSGTVLDSVPSIVSGRAHADLHYVEVGGRKFLLSAPAADGATFAGVRLMEVTVSPSAAVLIDTTAALGANANGNASGDVDVKLGPGLTATVFVLVGNNGFAAYTINITPPPLAGTKTIGGTSPDFATIREAVRALNLVGTAAPGVTFLIRSGVYNEDSLVIRTSTTGPSARVTFKPAPGATVEINVRPPSTAFDFAFKVDSTKYVTFDGSNSGTTTRDMTINATGGLGRRGLWFSGNCSYGVVKNCIVTAGRDTTQTAVSSSYRAIDFLYLSGTGNDADYVLIDNNLTKYAYTGIRIEGVTTGDVMLSPIVRNNLADSVCNAGIYSHYHADAMIYNNDVNVKRGSAATMYGIYVGSVTYRARVFNNRVHDLNQLNTTSSATYGIFTSTSTSTTYSYGQHSIYNNFIWGLNVPTTGTGGIYGIYTSVSNVTPPDTIAFNSINLSGTSGVLRPSYGYYKASATGGAVALNNILHNTRNDSTAITAAIGKTTAVTVLISNNNNLYVPVTSDSSKNVGVIGTVRYKTLAAWQTANASDAASFSENTPFVSPTDLHIQTGVPTQIESGAIPVAGITTDIDAQARNASTPDIGADEGGFTLNDLQPPAITHTPLANTNSTANRVASATIVDPSGVATGTGGPRLWHKLSTAGTYTAATVDSTSGNIRYFTVPGQAAGSFVQYYLAAQDLSPLNNTGTLPAGGSGINPPGSTPPPTVFSYAVRNPIAAGTYTIGVGGNYPTIDSAFKRLVNDGVAGAVTFTLTDTAYVALGKPLQNLRPAQPRFEMVNGRQEELALPSAYEYDAPNDTIPATTLTGPIFGASAATRITFRPAAGKAVRILGSGAYVLRLLDASFVTFDGINTGGASLKLQAIAGAGLQIEGNSDNVIVQNMSFATPNFTAMLTQSGSNGIPDSLLVQKNTVGGYSFNGFFALNLVVGTGVARGYTITNNDFGTATDSIAQAGLILQNIDGGVFYNNRIRNTYKTSALAGNNLGIGVQTKHFRLKIFNNVIRDVARRSGTAATITSGISVFGTTGDTTAADVYNNMMYGLDNQATSTTGVVRGIYLSTGINDRVAYNTVYLAGTDPVAILTAGLYSGATGQTWLNNIAINARTASGTGRAVSFYRTASGTPFMSNRNDLYVPTQAQSFVGAVGTTNYTTLTDWQATGIDSQSVSAMANFRAPDLHIDSAVASPISNGGAPVAGITTDIDGQSRHAATPDIGADEFGTPGIGPLLFEDFETAQFPPAGWSTYVVVGDSGWRSGTTAPLSGVQHAFNRYQTPGTLGSKFLVTKRVTLQAGRTYELSAWIRRAFTTAYPPDTVYFKMSTTDSLPASFTTTLYKCYTGDLADTATNPNIYGMNYRKFKTSVTGSGTRFFAFDHQDNDGQSIYLDDVKLEEVVITANDIGVEALTMPTAAANDFPTESIVARGLEGRAEKEFAEQSGIELEPVILSAPTVSQGDLAIIFKARVRNFGTGAVNSYQVGWSVDGAAQTPVNNTRPLAIGGRDTLTLTLATIAPGTHRARAWTILAGDPTPSNDSSAVLVFDVLPTNIVYEEIFADTLIPTGWKRVNVDGNTGTDTSWTFRQVVNFTSGGTVNPQAGRSFWFDNFNSANTSRLINDWLISPRINAADFDSLYFFAGAIGGQYPDSLRVFVSTTGNNVSDFTNQIAYFKVAGPVGTWTKYKFNLSAFDGQNIYIAVNYYMLDGGPSGNASDNVWVDHFVVTGTTGPQPGWTSQTSGITNQFYSVKAVNATTAWAAAVGGRVLRTTNGGGTWTSVGGGRIGTADIYAIDAVSSTTAFVTTTPSTATYIFRTTNGGTSWDTVFTQAGGFIDAFKMYDANNGIALGDPVGGKWVILTTTNGGASWSRLATEPTQVGTEAGTQNDLATFGTTHIWFGSSAAGRVYRSTNAGATWTSPTVPGAAAGTRVISVWFNDANYGIVGHYTTSGVYNAARSTDGGATWTATTVGAATTYNIAVAGSGVDFWMARGTDVFKSTNRGATWASSYTGAGTFYDLDFFTLGANTYGWGVKDNGNIVMYYGTISGVDGEENTLPTTFDLAQNYPNPFNPATTIRYALPEAVRVNLSIYNLLGQRVAELTNEVQSAGYYNVVWNGRNDAGSQVATGVYFYRIEATPNGGSPFVSLKKMLLLK
ncbi:MAG: choice-of-anchor J domain-containing protein [Ignavibacteriae bacterium]|nr:choice-of-anchor J domain-containing protein [Ignavibacteriota bacterium]